MRFLYKIYSNYDGFTPECIPLRLREDRYLELGWTRYLDAVDLGAECWIYFHGRHSFAHGIYVKGFISEINHDLGHAMLRVREYSTSEPLTDSDTTARIAARVSTRYRQVFLWPDDWDRVQNCHISACQDRRCERCPRWQALPIIDPTHIKMSPGPYATEIVPAYWIVPNRCYLYTDHKPLASWTTRITLMFGEFKLGERAYAYPLARGIFEALRRRSRLKFDAIVPIPLSPDKETSGEVHRTKLLAQELGKLLGVSVRECLKLTEPVSKRRMLASGYTLTDFRRRYYHALNVSRSISDCSQVLIVDDVITRGATLYCATRRLREAQPDLDIVVASAGQMIVKSAVRDESGFLE